MEQVAHPSGNNLRERMKRECGRSKQSLRLEEYKPKTLINNWLQRKGSMPKRLSMNRE